jgi:ABC-2 type transport system permease protein
MLAIYKKELRSYFTSMIGYVFIAFFLVIIGIYFYFQNLYSAYANFEYTVTNVTFIFVLLVPLLTMRLMAEENRQKTDQLLFTSPVTPTAIVLGKFLAVFTVFGAVMAIICTYPLIMNMYGDVPFASSYASIFGFAILGGAYLAIGFFISSLTESLVVAAVISFIVFLFTVLMDGIAGFFPADNKTAYVVFSAILVIICIVLYLMMKNPTISICAGLAGELGLTAAYLLKPALFDGLIVKVFGWFSVIDRFDNFRMGILDMASIIYYISIIFLFLFLTVQVIRKKRWS